MEHQVENNNTKPEPAEVVEVYRHPEPQEVVEVYTRPLSWLTQKPPAPKKRSKKGLWIFLGCLSVVAVLAVIGWFVTGSADGDAAAERDKDPFEWYYEEDGRTEQPDEITIPTVKPEPNVRLNVTAEHGEELPLQEIYQRVNPAVVTVMAQGEDALSVGTGVMFTENGYIAAGEDTATNLPGVFAAGDIREKISYQIVTAAADGAVAAHMAGIYITERG